MSNKQIKWYLLKLFVYWALATATITLVLEYVPIKLKELQPVVTTQLRELTPQEKTRLAIYDEVLRNDLSFRKFQLLVRIANAESHLEQFKPDGTVTRGIVNHKDVGLFQINETYHLAEAQSLGIDLYTLEGNVKYGVLLFMREGTTPWNWSKASWSVSYSKI